MNQFIQAICLLIFTCFFHQLATAQITATLPANACLTCGSSGTLPGDPATCTGSTVNGSYEPGTSLDGSQTVDVQVNVTTIGDYVITTDAINGYVFTGLGTFAATGVQTVTLTGTGTPSTAQTDNFTVSYGGSSCTFDVVVAVAGLPILPVGGLADCTNYSTEVVEITSPFTGRVWMDRNLGASRAALDKDDYFSYGCLFAWGRQADGSEIVTWTDYITAILTPVISTLSSTITPGHSNWINDAGYGDWLVSPRNDLWQGVSGLNNPCPKGFRLPTRAELETETDNWGNLAHEAASSFLKLPNANNRRSVGGGSSGVNVGHYWTSTISTPALSVKSLVFGHYIDEHKSHGASVRCIKN